MIDLEPLAGRCERKADALRSWIDREVGRNG
jgi:hypothetical protein